MSMTKLKLLAALGVIGLTLVVASTSASPQPDEPVPSVGAKEGTFIVKQADFSLKTSQAGTVQPFETINLTPKFSGYLKSLNVDIGDHVKRGQVVAEIDAPELVLEAEKAKAVVSQAEAKLLTARAAVEVAQASLNAKTTESEVALSAVRRFESLQAEQEKVFQRLKRLGEQDAIEQKMVDEGAGKVETAKSAVAEAKAQVTVTRAGIEEAKARVQAAKSSVVEAQADLQVAMTDLRKAEVQRESTTIRSPIDGIVTRRSHAPGDFIRSGNEPNSSPMLTIVRADNVRVVVDVPDRDVPFLDRGDPVSIGIDAIPGRVFEGTISRTAYAEDPGTRTLRTEIDLDNADGKLRPGQFGRVEITLDVVANCLTIPRTAAFLDPSHADKGMFCYQIVDGRTVKTPIKLGRSNGNAVVVDEGLKAGDVVWLAAPSIEPNGSQAPAKK